MHVRDHVLPVDDERRSLRHAQRDVEHGAVLGDVDAIAAEHRGGPLGEPGFLSQLEQEPDRLVRDAVLRVVEVQAGACGGEALAPGRVLREEVAQVEVADLGVVGLERLPGRALPEWRRAGLGHGHRGSSSRLTR